MTVKMAAEVTVGAFPSLVLPLLFTGDVVRVS